MMSIISAAVSGYTAHNIYSAAETEKKIDDRDAAARRQGRNPPARQPVPVLGWSVDQMRKPDDIIAGVSKSYLETVAGSVLVRYANILGARACKQWGITTGNQHMKRQDIVQLLQHRPWEIVMRSCIAGPILEETVFRLFPSELMVGEAGNTKVLTAGAVSSLIFALMHNVRTGPDGRRHFAKGVPFQQFNNGVLFWWLMRTKGWDHAVLSHIGLNSYEVFRTMHTMNAATKKEPTSKPQ